MDPYRELGVARSASPEEIRKAYRKLAKELHPDARPGDKDAEERFKRITAAFDLLSNTEKRARYDRGEIDGQGHERAYAGGARGAQPGGGQTGMDDVDLNDILNSMFGGGRGGAGPGGGFGGFGGSARGPFQARGADIRYTLPLDFLEAARGGDKRVTMSDGRTLNLRIPEGVKTGQVLRLRGQGRAGMNGPPGDAMVEIDVRPHRHFTRDGDNVVLEVPISLQEAVLGARISVPTLEGSVSLTIPKLTSSGRQLRLRGKGFKSAKGRGDQLVKVRIVMPETDEPELEKFFKGWKPKQPQDPRRGF